MRCPVCGSTDTVRRFAVTGEATEQGVDAVAFRPSADAFGRTTGDVRRCRACGHGFVDAPPDNDVIAAAYADAADEVSTREEAGQVETARRALARVEHVVAPGTVVDVGCWTGSFLVAACERGWTGVGVEPSAWASQRARARGVDVRTGRLGDVDLPAGRARLVAMCDVLEHVQDPATFVRSAVDLLDGGGALYLTVPDAGSGPARLLGRRWWSVLPMHLQYFTRASLRRLLSDAGLIVRAERTHTKVFTARYYAERFGGYSEVVARTGVAVLERARLADRLVAPDLRDRVEVIATRG